MPYAYIPLKKEKENEERKKTIGDVTQIKFYLAEKPISTSPIEDTS